MTFDEYQRLAARTAVEHWSKRDRLLHAAVGMNEEAGEAAKPIKKHCFFGHGLDHVEVAGELGDLLWYLSEAATALGLRMDEIASANVAKLRKRYPDGFTREASKARADERPVGLAGLAKRENGQ